MFTFGLNESLSLFRKFMKKANETINQILISLKIKLKQNELTYVFL